MTAWVKSAFRVVLEEKWRVFKRNFAVARGRNMVMVVVKLIIPA
jgi:hypothetical protein